MRRSLLAAVAISPLLLLSLVGLGRAQAPEAPRVSAPEAPRLSGPVVHANLAVYFIHGRSVPGKVPLTLEEAMTRGIAKVRETSNVNELEIENLGDDEVFVQAGDIVKGGQQDRTLMVSLVLPPRSGRIPIASFCVEEGRWSARGGEDAKSFSSASAAVPSRELKLAMKAPMPQPAVDAGADVGRGRNPALREAAGETSRRQQRVWDNVRKTQTLLSSSLGAQVRARQSASSLQLALENEKLMDAQQTYLRAMKAAGEKGDDIVGFVFAVNGELNSADVYPSNGLFRKMWSKLLTAAVIEAIGQRSQPAVAPPPADAAAAFLASAEKGTASARPLAAGTSMETREGDKTYLFETARVAAPGTPAAWVHRNYLAR
jgi:hypothetical protein